ncbi:YkvA family protein [Lysobacter niabensis]|uniref:YkvA family protein n=1 Tax=Agrilutibacter niabensis TaxID=380628 RepID=UPI00361156EA
MPLTINIELTDQDLEHFTRAKEKAFQAAAGKSNEEVAQAATELLGRAQQSNPPEFVKQRLLVLDTLIAMLRDEAWALSEADAGNVRAALSYFAAPADAVPDTVPVLGFVDDAIMIELCARDLHHEIDAYDDFCDFRQCEAGRQGQKPETVGRADWLEGRREELQDRMRRRRTRESGRAAGVGYGSSTGYGSTSSYASARSYSDSAWRPGPLSRLR